MSKRHEYTEEDIVFMSEVDAAMLDRGRRSAYLLTFAVFLLFVAFVVWAHESVLDEVTRGNGQVIPSQRIQVIQNLEGGILEEILVQENGIVNKGTILVRLRNEQAVSTYRDAKTRALEHQAAIARLEVEASTDPSDKAVAIEFPEEVLNEMPEVAKAQERIYRARRDQLRSELNVLQSQYSQKSQEIVELRSRRRQLKRSLALAVEKRDTAKPLMERKVYPRMDYLAHEQEVLTIQGDIEAVDNGLPRVSGEREEIRRRISQRKAEFHSEILTELSQRRVEMKSLLEAISAGADRVTRTDVRSPVKGTVKQIILNTIGGVVKPGEPILEIVPLDDTLLVEVKIRPADIAFLHPGQRAQVKITAYDFSIYGGLEGVVEQISADTIEDERGESFYKVKVRTQESTLTYRGDELPIIPGMTASVDILTGKKSVLDYLLKPIMKAKQNALRER